MTDHTRAAPIALLSSRENLAFVAGFVAILFACFFAPRALSFAPAVFGVVGVIYLRIRTHGFPAFDKHLALFFAALVALAAIAALWSHDPGYALARAAKTAPILLGGLALFALAGAAASDIPHKNRIAFGAALALILAFLGIAFEYASGFSITRAVIDFDETRLPAGIRNGFMLNRNLVYIVLLAPPVLLMLRLSTLQQKTKIALCAALVVAMLAALLQSPSQTAQITALFSILVFALPFHRRKMRLALMAILLGAIFVAPLLPPAMHDAFLKTETSKLQDGLVREASIAHRLEVWNFIAQKIHDKPLIGHGTEATRFLKSDAVMPNMGTDHVLHPHNAVLQLWIEFGLMGAIFAAAFTVFLLRRIDALEPMFQRYFTALFLIMLCMLSMGYGLWQAWQLGMIMAITALSVMAIKIFPSGWRD